MAIHSKYLEALEAVIATALNIVKNRPLVDLYAHRDYRASSVSGSSLQAGNATSSRLERNDS